VEYISEFETRHSRRTYLYLGLGVSWGYTCSYCLVNTRPCLTGIFKILIQGSTNSEIHKTSFWNLQWTPGGVPPLGENRRFVKLTAHLHLMPTLKMSGAIPLFPPYVRMFRTLKNLLLPFIIFGSPIIICTKIALKIQYIQYPTSGNKQWAPGHSRG